jgi:hypothetical protein
LAVVGEKSGRLLDHLRITLSEKPGIYTRMAAFLIDDEGIRHVSFRLTGRVLPPRKLADARSEKE